MKVEPVLTLINLCIFLGFSGKDCEIELDMCLVLHPCLNEGTCTGSLSSFKCHCPIGYGGATCQDSEFKTLNHSLLHAIICTNNVHINKQSNITDFLNCLSGVSFSSQISLSGDGWLELKQELLPHKSTTENEVISIRFTTNDTNSLVLWYGQPPDVDGRNQDYLSLASMYKFTLCHILSLHS